MPGTSRSGRKTLPTEIKEIKGTRRPYRENKYAPQPERPAFLEPPAHLNDVAAEEFTKKAELLDRLGVLKEGDEVALAVYADAYARWVEAVKMYNKSGPMVKSQKFRGKDKDGEPIYDTVPVRNPIAYAINNAVDTMYRYLTEFGLSPASRCRIKVDSKMAESEWEKFSADINIETEDCVVEQYNLQ